MLSHRATCSIRSVFFREFSDLGLDLSQQKILTLALGIRKFPRYLSAAPPVIFAIIIDLCSSGSTVKKVRRKKTRMEQQRCTGNTSADIRLLQLNVNIDFINISLLVTRYTHTHTFSSLSRSLRLSLAEVNISAVSCFGTVVISLTGDITMDSQIHFPLSIIQM